MSVLPKSAVFGGVTRARISSQCLKRAIRLDFNHAHADDPFRTERTKLAHEGLARTLVEKGISSDLAERLSVEVLSRLVDKAGSAKAKPDKSGRLNLPALIWLSPGQIAAAASAIAAKNDEIQKAMEVPERATDAQKKAASAALKKALTPISKAIREAGISDAPDIALFGRMVANDPTLNVEGTAMFSHALSTHAATNEVDFYPAVDDVKFQRGEDQNDDADDAGAGMIGTLEFNSATYYRYVAVNLDLLADARHLGALKPEERKAVLRAFLEAGLTAIPSARRNAMNGATLPFEVLGIRKESGQPLQLINAFEKPVRTKAQGYGVPSLAALREHLECLEKVWGDQGSKVWLTEAGLSGFLDQLLQGDV